MAIPRIILSCEEVFPEWEHCKRCPKSDFGQYKTVNFIHAPTIKYHSEFQSICCLCVPKIQHLSIEEWDRVEKEFGLPRAEKELARRAKVYRANGQAKVKRFVKLCEVCGQEPAESGGLCRTCRSTD